jgi:fucose 4-O-acetylase-like acetyltransferase
MLKGMGILLVVLSHTSIDELTSAVLYLFHMPLFFFVSGLLFRERKYPRLADLLRRRWQTLILPYFVYSLTTWALWYFVARHYGADASLHIDPLLPLLGTLYSVANDPWLSHNAPLWFLTCLFVVEALYWCLNRGLRSRVALWAVVLGCSAAGFCLSRHPGVRLPWGADVALTAVVFYAAGHLSSGWLVRTASGSRGIWWSLAVPTGVLGVLGMWWGFSYVNMSENDLGGSYAHFYAASFGGIAMSIVVAQLVPPSAGLCWIGRNTLPILALQIAALGFVKAVQQYVIHIPVASTLHSTLYGIAQSAGVLLVMIPVIQVIDRWVPLLSGSSRAAGGSGSTNARECAAVPESGACRCEPLAVPASPPQDHSSRV